MSIKTEIFPNGPLGENTYLVTDESTGFKAVIDPGYLGDDVRSAVGNAGDLKYIMLTHGHYDHYAAVEAYISEYPDATFIAPEGDTYLMYQGRDNKWIAANFGLSGVCPEAHKLVNEGDEIVLGGTVFRVISTPGHTEGGICFATDREVFSGDTLFRLSVGNSNLETGNFETMVSSIKDKLYTLDDEMIVYPGHGPATTIGYEKKANPFV
jgi:glyoxylase-like metal-dependent hydrolase (beta-lactamase superfamily II)